MVDPTCLIFEADALIARPEADMNDSAAAEIVNVRFNELRMKNPPKYCFIYVTFMLQRYLITIRSNCKHLQPKNDLFFYNEKQLSTIYVHVLITYKYYIFL
ncbi:hypothetical protein LBR02_17910 [Levilactobacillus brevis]|nr:hypothetical protein LBR02_17910 [Levilactobacillus brevis]